jgi:multiple sugar transport system substrate-binding protein
VDLSVFTDVMRNKVRCPSPVHGDGAALRDAPAPLFEAYFAGQEGDSASTDMLDKSRTLLAKS